MSGGNEVCRLCLCPATIHHSLFENNSVQMLEALTSIKVTDDDIYSKIVCLGCQVNLKTAYDIQQSFITANNKLIHNELVKEEVELEVADLCVNSHETSAEVKEEEGVKVEIEDEEDFQNLVHLSDGFCIICNCTIDDDFVISHLKEHYEEEQDCEFCFNTFEDVHSYKVHLISCHSEHSFKYHECEQCKINLQYKSFRDLHVQSKHDPQLDSPDEEIDIEDNTESLSAEDSDVDVVSVDTDVAFNKGPYNREMLNRKFKLAQGGLYIVENDYTTQTMEFKRLSEKVRRFHMMTKFTDLRKLVPEVANFKRAPKKRILRAAANFCGLLASDYKRRHSKLTELKEENARLQRVLFKLREETKNVIF